MISTPRRIPRRWISLLNYETVKYFGNEEHETRRFDRSMTGYEAAALKTSYSLAALNFGQSLIITTGLDGGDGDGGARRRRMACLTVGDFVMVNAYMIQIYHAAELSGHGLSRNPAEP